jgi:NADPH:quinone reductase-like Zn-dependent oxidoreductase
VGVFAIQLAKRIGAHVITTASARNFDFLSKLGADEMIDYRTARFEESTRDLNVIFDTVGGETLRRSWDLLEPNGRMVTIAANSEGTRDERIEKAFFIMEPHQKQLTEVARLIGAGELKVFVDAIVPFARASDAYEGRVKERRGYGKMIILVND